MVVLAKRSYILTRRSYIFVVKEVSYLVAKMVASLHAPWTKKRLHYSDVLTALDRLRPGDIILTRTEGEASTYFIPGRWKHASVYLGKHMVIEANGNGIIENWIQNLIMRTDYIAIMRCYDLSEIEACAVADESKKFIGWDYDFRFNMWDSKRAYCSGIAFRAINTILGRKHIKTGRFLGVPVFTPDDCYTNRARFELVLEL